MVETSRQILCKFVFSSCGNATPDKFSTHQIKITFKNQSFVRKPFLICCKRHNPYKAALRSKLILQKIYAHNSSKQTLTIHPQRSQMHKSKHGTAFIKSVDRLQTRNSSIHVVHSAYNTGTSFIKSAQQSLYATATLQC